MDGRVKEIDDVADDAELECDIATNKKREALCTRLRYVLENEYA